MQQHNNDVMFAINIHERLVRDFPETPYILWCRWVHKQHLTCFEKWERLLTWKVDPSEYSNPTLFRYDWQAFKLLSKLSVGNKITDVEKDVAYRKFRASEDRCYHLNKQWSDSIPTHTAKLLHSMKNIIASVLGSVDDFIKWAESQAINHPQYVADQFSGKYGGPERDDFSFYTSPFQAPSFGPGVSVGARGSKLTTYSEKIVLGTCTPQSADFVAAVCKLWEGILPLHYHGVRGSILTFVYKRVGEARAICYEPSMNMLVQKLFGLYLKHRLKVCLGIDLSNQERNRSLAELGSLCDSYCTIDLTSASDLNSYQLVLNCLSPSWFNFLDRIRSKEYYDQDTKQWETFQKFSTMGNGFTFELETLIFASIVKSAIDMNHESSISWREISCYGDDLIFPKEYYTCVCQALLACGHIPNVEKSFSSGPFRESCGGDFFKGWNVTPCKIKEVSLDDPQSVVNIYNHLYISAGHFSNLHSISDRFNRALKFIRSWLIKHYPRISEGDIEYGKFSYTMRRYSLEPSNRFLWAARPSFNSLYSTHLQTQVPRWLLLKENSVIRRRTAKGFEACNYDISEDVVLYHIHRNIGDRLLREKEPKCVFRRNKDLFILRKSKQGTRVRELNQVAA